MNDKPKDGSVPSREEELNEKIEDLMGPVDQDLNKETSPSLYKPDYVDDPLISSSMSKEPNSAPPVKEEEIELPKEIKLEPIQDQDDIEANQTLKENDIDDPTTSKAIDEIVANESDEILEAEDAKLSDAFEPKQKTGFTQKIKDFFKSWWGNPKKRKLTIILSVAALFVLLMIPPSRYFMLNTVGVRASASMTIIDNSTQQPLKNVKISLAGVSEQTDIDGKVTLRKLRLGPSELMISKTAFTALSEKVTVGLGSNPLGDYKLTPAGTQYTFVLSDFLSGKPIVKAEASSGQASALSDKDGKVVLTVDDIDGNTLKVSIKADQYREEKVTINIENKEQDLIKMVPARKQVFVSKRSGKYDVYKIDVDGNNEEKVLAGSGIERDDIVLVPHPTDEVVVMISTRENVRDKDGFLLSTLTLIDLNDNTPMKVAQSERIQIIDWIGERLIFVQIATGTSANDPNRHRLMSYDYKNDQTKELASSNYFNDVTVVTDNIYYSPSTAYQNANNIGLFRINSDGSNKKTIINQEVWNIFRVSYDHLNLAVQQDWYDYKIGDDKANKMNGTPSNPKTRVYISSPDKSRHLWVDQRDGKGVLLAYNTGDSKDIEVTKQSSLKYPIRWINNFTAIYRISSDQESADYVVNLDGGEPKKIVDVTNTGGIDKWYYY